MSSNIARLADRLAKLEAARLPDRPRIVRTHILDCPLHEREARMAAIDAAEPDAFHIVRVIIDPAEIRGAP